IHTAVLDACDANDGVKDGVLEDPRSCTFDPKVLTCTNGDAASCLTPQQVDTAHRMYTATKNPRTGAVLSRGYEFGSELGWGAIAGPKPETDADEMFTYMVYQDPKWDWRTFSIGPAYDLASKDVYAPINAVDANLTAFFGRGGKLLMYHGWADPRTPPEHSIDYYASVIAASGTKARDSIRLFMVPGMG